MRPRSTWVDVEGLGGISEESRGAAEQSLPHSILLPGTVQLRAAGEADWVVSEHPGLGVPSATVPRGPGSALLGVVTACWSCATVLSVSRWVCSCLLWFWVEVQRVGSGGNRVWFDSYSILCHSGVLE